MRSAESRTYVTTTTNRWAVTFLSDMAATLRDAKIHCLKLLLQRQLSQSQINTELQQQFKINKRQANSIIAYIEGHLKSARSCRDNHLEQLQGKLKHATLVVIKLEKKIKAHRKYLQAVEQVNRGQKKKIPKYLKPQYQDACPIRCYHHLTRYRQAQVKLHHKKR
ncbi:hypothetical protein [Microseira sp. BLCC-F43]|jgi:hypothetical protein|uniref:hypothetical protein n=1 Tax=Microseira sp. BLCC-F43 TaxID=3153602 RepID=UPI0035BB93AD